MKNRLSDNISIKSKHLEDVLMSNVTLADSYEKNAFSLEKEYLLSIDSDRLLRGFCDIAKIKSNAPLYGGWETSDIQGHTLGHYLTAVSQVYASDGDIRFKEIAKHIIDVLCECSNKKNGYLAAIPENHYEKLEQGITKGTWVPWYSMHKILSGIIKAYELCGINEALTVASALGDWVYSRTSQWSEETQKTVLRVEYGGMNDCLYQLYSHTKSNNHLSAAHSFDEIELFESMYNKIDILDGKHANTTIPKIIGALNRYKVLGENEEFYLKTAINFWDIVINNHTYITGGNSEWEHFGKPGILDAERTECNCETCNTYNMLKLTRELFKITGVVKYADYYENTFINAILSSQNPETGMTTYFQPMATGYFKVYSSPFDHFWCCTGSGMENFSKLGDSIYFKDDSTLYFFRYTSCEYNWEEKNLTVSQKVEFPDVRISISGSADASIALRIPDWCCGKPSVIINGKPCNHESKGGFIYIDKAFSHGDVIDCEFPIKVKAHTLPDNANSVAFRYGPYVLSANLGNKNMNTSTTGVNVTVPLSDETAVSSISTHNQSVDLWKNSIENSLIKSNDTPEFTLKSGKDELLFSPHYLQHKNRYGIYFVLNTEN